MSYVWHDGTQAIDETGMALDTLRLEVYVSGSVQSGLRKPDLSWSHHLAVAPLPEEEQEHWLEYAVREKLSRRDLRAVIIYIR